MKKHLLIVIVLFIYISVFAQPAAEVAHTPQMKIVSGYYISSSACIAMGLKDNLAAIEANADQRPIYALAAPELMKVPSVGTAKSFNLETCLSVEPDLVILPKKQKDMATVLEELGIKTLVVNPESHEELIEMFEQIGEAAGHRNEASKLIEKYNHILSEVEQRAKTATTKPVVYICGTGSYLTTSPSGMYQADLIELAGGINAGSVLDGGSRVEVSYEQLISFNPDIIIIPTNSNANGFPAFSAEDILNNPQLSEIKAVKTKSIYRMPVGLEAWDSPVPSGALGALWMLKTIHPELCSEEEFSIMVNDFYRELYGFEAGF